MSGAIRLDRRARAALRRRAPKPPTGAMLVYRVALRRALVAQQKRLWAIIERNYEEPKKDGLGVAYTIERAQSLVHYSEDGALYPEPGTAVIRIDAPADGGASKLKSEHIAIAPKTLDLAAGRVAKHAVDETARLLGVQFKGGEKRRVPGGISRASQGADEKVIASFRKRNLSLIKRLEKQQVEELGDVLKEATAAGWTVARLRSVVMRRFEVARSHADLIARDQVLKLNGELQQMRQTKAGITEYVWSTSNDERVRPEHAELDGKRFSWDDPPESGANGEHEHPGQGISCRCVAIPVVPWLEED